MEGIESLSSDFVFTVDLGRGFCVHFTAFDEGCFRTLLALSEGNGLGGEELAVKLLSRARGGGVLKELAFFLEGKPSDYKKMAAFQSWNRGGAALSKKRYRYGFLQDGPNGEAALQEFDDEGWLTFAARYHLDDLIQTLDTPALLGTYKKELAQSVYKYIFPAGKLRRRPSQSFEIVGVSPTGRAGYDPVLEQREINLLRAAQKKIEQKNGFQHVPTALDVIVQEVWGRPVNDEIYVALLLHTNCDQAKKTKDGFFVPLANDQTVEYRQAQGARPEMITATKKRDFSQDAADVIVAFAVVRGWTSVNLHGTASQKEMLWIAAKRKGLQVDESQIPADAKVRKLWAKESSLGQQKPPLSPLIVI